MKNKYVIQFMWNLSFICMNWGYYNFLLKCIITIIIGGHKVIFKYLYYVRSKIDQLKIMYLVCFFKYLQ